MVRYAAMDRLLTYGKILFIGVIATLIVVVNNYTSPDNYIFTESNDRAYYIKMNTNDGTCYFTQTRQEKPKDGSPRWVKFE